MRAYHSTEEVWLFWKYSTAPITDPTITITFLVRPSTSRVCYARKFVGEKFSFHKQSFIGLQVSDPWLPFPGFLRNYVRLSFNTIDQQSS